jgi:dTDP-4-amino-4,6-dideoxygalactose transaminase
MRESFLIFGSPMIGDEEIAEVVDSLRSGWVGTGPKVQRFEQLLSAYVGAPEVRCVSSCTAALILALRVLGIGRGDEVLVPAMTFVAGANAVEHSGATPVLVDSDPRTGLIDLDAAAAAVTTRTRAIMPVHLAGRPVDMDRATAIADRHGLLVVEDAAHAIGAEWRGRRIGSLGNVTAFSFYVTKSISTVEGGAVATDDPEIAAQIERLALHGLASAPGSGSRTRAFATTRWSSLASNTT